MYATFVDVFYFYPKKATQVTLLCGSVQVTMFLTVFLYSTYLFSCHAFESCFIRNNAFSNLLQPLSRFRNKMTQAGFTIAGSAHPICPVMLGDARLASVMADDMLKLGEAAA